MLPWQISHDNGQGCGDACLQATLSFDAKAGERVGVTVKVDEDGPDVLICSLREGQSESQSLDLIFDS